MSNDGSELWIKRLGPTRRAGSDPELDAIVAVAADAEMYGASASPDAVSLEQVVADRGADGLAAVLIALANRRWAAIDEQIGLPGSFVLPRLARLASIDGGLTALGLRYRRPRGRWLASREHEDAEAAALAVGEVIRAR